VNTTGYHTCQARGKPEEITGPFLATYDEQIKKYQYLGTGYYFWEDDIELARSWGKQHYKGRYYIFEAQLFIADNTLLDLLGDSSARKYILTLMKTFSNQSKIAGRWTMGALIEFMRKEAPKGSEMFPYKAIRAADNSYNRREDTHPFAPDQKSFINLNPKIIICLFGIEQPTIQLFRYLPEQQ
jgi:hypothetical protein